MEADRSAGADRSEFMPGEKYLRTVSSDNFRETRKFRSTDGKQKDDWPRLPENQKEVYNGPDHAFQLLPAPP